MSSGELISQNDEDPELTSNTSTSNEIQFALVLARMIETVKNDPSDMRRAIYDLARYKLREQFTHEDVKDIRYIEQALETAIRGVEEFSRQNVAIPGPAQQIGRNTVPPPQVLAPPALPRPGMESDQAPPAALTRSNSPWPMTKRMAALLVVIGVLAVAFQQRERLVALANYRSGAEGQAAAVQPEVARAATPAPPLKPRPLRPTDYGVYAIGAEALSELQPLPGRPPDIRVAVSAAIKEPSRTMLPNGHPRFLVFRRDVATNISDRADVRIIAKVAREFSADAAGAKPDTRDGTWIIRNVAFPFRASPAPDNPDMYELHSEDPALELTPGRYALVLKNQAYDFTVEGRPTDVRHCIERVVSTSGTFYTDCRKP